MSSKQTSLLGIIVLLSLLTLIVVPVSVYAEGDPPPTPLPPASGETEWSRITPPEVRGVNPHPAPEEGVLSEIEASGNAGQLPAGVTVSSEAPEYVDLAPQTSGSIPSVSTALGVPLRLQPANDLDVSCGVQALGMVMDFQALTTGDETPTSAEMLSQLGANGLLYGHGTGVEELAYLARQNGYAGSYSFHNWNLSKLQEELQAGRPVVVSLGINGENTPGHFVTVTGVSEDGRWVSYNDPALGKMTVPAEQFMEEWGHQGHSGMVTQREALANENDPMVPVMGVFSALSALMVLASQQPWRKDIAAKITTMQDVLADPERLGIGGRRRRRPRRRRPRRRRPRRRSPRRRSNPRAASRQRAAARRRSAAQAAARRRAAAQAASRRRAAAQAAARRRAAAQAAARKRAAAQAAARRRAASQAAARRRAAAQAAARRRAAAQAAARRRAAAQAAQRRAAAQAAARRRASLAAKLKAEREARLKAAEEARRRAQEEDRRKAEEAQRKEQMARQAALLKAKRETEAAAQRRASFEARPKAEKEARLKAAEEARRRAQEEAARQAALASWKEQDMAVTTKSLEPDRPTYGDTRYGKQGMTPDTQPDDPETHKDPWHNNPIYGQIPHHHNTLEEWREADRITTDEYMQNTPSSGWAWDKVYRSDWGETYVSQGKGTNDCGPSNLAIMFNALTNTSWDKTKVSPWQLGWPFPKDTRGATPPWSYRNEFNRIARLNNIDLIAKNTIGTRDTLINELNNGNPVTIIRNYPTGESHYQTIVGYDAKTKKIFFIDPGDGYSNKNNVSLQIREQSWAKFNNDWSRSLKTNINIHIGKWTLVNTQVTVLKPNQMIVFTAP